MESMEKGALMEFRVVDQRFSTSLSNLPCVLLERRRWDDYGYKTLFHAYYVTAKGEQQFLGPVKILEREKPSTDLQGKFPSLSDQFCSLGQELEYYQRLHALGEETCREILTALRDVAYDASIRAEWESADGFDTSLLRFSGARTAMEEGSRLFSSGPPSPTTLSIAFTTTLQGFDGPHDLNLDFLDGAGQLGRITALVGENGTGKTRLLAKLAETLSGITKTELSPSHHPAGVVALSFSAFDRFTRPASDILGSTYRYYGLRTPSANPVGAKTDHEAADAESVPRKRRREHDGRVDIEIAFESLGDSLRHIQRMSGDEGDRRRQAWTKLMEEVGFFDAEPDAPRPFEDGVDAFVDGLETASSGYQILTFVITGLLESIRERTLVLFDEPELHLHPSMIGALVRVLYDTLEEFGAYALLATHSPIVLQEIPARSVRIIACVDRVPGIRPYSRESFGANLSEIVRTAFGMLEDEKNYVLILKKLAETRSEEDVEALFNDLGVGVRMLIRDIYKKRAAR